MGRQFLGVALIYNHGTVIRLLDATFDIGVAARVPRSQSFG
jgi:hypothetical protein